MPVATWQASCGAKRSKRRPPGLYSKGTGRNACRYLASNQKSCHAEQSEEQEYRPPGLYSKGTGRNACRYLASNLRYSKGTGRNACRYLAMRSKAKSRSTGLPACTPRGQAGMPVATCRFGITRNLRNSRNIRNIRNIRNNYVASRISARENRAGGRLCSWLCLAYGGRGGEEK